MEALGRWDLHRELPPPPNGSSKHGGGDGFSDNYSSSSSFFSGPRSSKNYSNNWGRAHGGGGGNRTLTHNNKPIEKVSKVCNFWIQGNYGYGEKCRYLHSWSISDNFSMVAQLEGHLKVVLFKGLCDFDCFLGFLFLGFDFGF